MKTIKLLTITLWTIFLTSCRQQIICSNIKMNMIDPVPMYDISLQFNRCRVRCFDMNNWSALPLTSCPNLPQGFEDASFIENEKLIEAINLPLESCEGIAGFNPDSIASEIRPNIKSMASIRKDTCGF